MVQINFTAVASLFTLLSVVSASVLIDRQDSTTSPIDGEGGQFGIAVSTPLQICTEGGLKGDCFTWTTQPLDGNCYSLAVNRPELNNRVSSVIIEESFAVCDLFDNDHCEGESVKMFGGAVADLDDHGFENRMTTWKCTLNAA